MSTQTLKPIDPAEASGKTKELLDHVQQRSKRIPNMVLLMANSPAALGAYLGLAGAFREAKLSAELLDLIAITVAQASGSDYTLSAVCALSRIAGRSANDIAAARKAESHDVRTASALRFAAKVIEKRAHVGGPEVAELHQVGFTDAEITEIIAAVILTLYRSYFNLIAQPEIDFPVVEVTSP